MANDEFDQIGFTIHFVSPVVDGGRIVLQRRVAVRKDVSFGAAVADVARQGLNGFIEVVDRLLFWAGAGIREQEKGGTHYPPIGWRALRRAAGISRVMPPLDVNEGAAWPGPGSAVRALSVARRRQDPRPRAVYALRR
jgi:hypothetical protein